MISSAIQTAFDRAKKMGWWKLYVAVDVHGAIFPSTDKKEKQRDFFPGSVEALQYLSSRVDVDLMIFTCSHNEEIEEVIQLLGKRGIKFSFINENPEVVNDARGNYDFKPYYNILIDDKAGFIPSEWTEITDTFKKYPELKQPN